MNRERAREVEREVFEVVAVATDRVLGLAFVPRAEDRLGGVLAAVGDGERSGEAGARVSALHEGDRGHRGPPVVETAHASSSSRAFSMTRTDSSVSTACCWAALSPW